MAGSGSSFESPHNAIHNSVGGSFLSLDLTAFDSLLYVCTAIAFYRESEYSFLQSAPPL